MITCALVEDETLNNIVIYIVNRIVIVSGIERQLTNQCVIKLSSFKSAPFFRI